MSEEDIIEDICEICDEDPCVCDKEEMNKIPRGGNIYCNHPYSKLRIGISYNYTSGVEVECECGFTADFACGNLE